MQLWLMYIKANLRRTSTVRPWRTERQHRSNAKDVIRRVVAPDDMDLVEGKGDRTPGGLPLAAKAPDIPAARLPQAEMRLKPASKLGHVAAVGNLVPQSLVQRFDRGGRFGGQVEGAAAGGMPKKAEAQQSHLKRRLQTAGLGQDGGDPLKFR